MCFNERNSAEGDNFVFRQRPQENGNRTGPLILSVFVSVAHSLRIARPSSLLLKVTDWRSKISLPNQVQNLPN